MAIIFKNKTREMLYYFYISRLLLAYLHPYVEKHVCIFCSNIPFWYPADL